MKFRKLFSMVFISLFVLFGTFPSNSLAQNLESDFKTRNDTFRVLITGVNKEKNSIIQSLNLTINRDFAEDGFTVTVNEKQYEALLKNKNLSIEKVNTVKIAVAKSENKINYIPSTQVPWGIKAIYNNSTLSQTTGGDGIKVAVLDTGVYTSHIDLRNNVEQCKDFTRTSTYVNNSCADRNGHGTHVAGTILADGGSDGRGIYGVAPDAKLWAYKVLGDNGSGYSDDIAYAIRHAADEAVRTGSKVVINMSLGSSGKDSLITDAVNYAYNRGALIVAAAGNSGPNSNTIGYPGALTTAIAVAALENVQQNGTYRVANFSSRGNPITAGDYIIQERDIEVSAPGASIESTWHNGRYNTISGTSMATPHVAGLAAKLWALNKNMTNSQLRLELQNRAKQYDIKGGTGATTGDDYASGFGFPRVR
ncbi:S8 family peptidase [Bacillus kwashiorkori]|uniref:S8 family peptidase n=1 Tax=Bacillus kwashiorkori TaxID=1522318 RepID=UPI000AF11F18|nr:S8 family peptidase [Bacillus kwashiorkori]